MKHLISLLLIVSLLSCKTRQIIPSKETKTVTKDSTYTTLKVVDTLQVLRPSDTAKIAMPLSRLTEKPIQIKSKQATVTLRKIGNEIQAECICDELKQAVKIYKETITRQTETITEQKETLTLLQNEMSFMQKLFFYIGLGLAVFIGTAVLVRFIIPSLSRFRK